MRAGEGEFSARTAVCSLFGITCTEGLPSSLAAPFAKNSPDSDLTLFGSILFVAVLTCAGLDAGVLNK